MVFVLYALPAIKIWARLKDFDIDDIIKKNNEAAKKAQDKIDATKKIEDAKKQTES